MFFLFELPTLKMETSKIFVHPIVSLLLLQYPPFVKWDMEYIFLQRWPLFLLVAKKCISEGSNLEQRARQTISLALHSQFKTATKEISKPRKNVFRLPRTTYNMRALSKSQFKLSKDVTLLSFLCWGVWKYLKDSLGIDQSLSTPRTPQSTLSMLEMSLSSSSQISSL